MLGHYQKIRSLELRSTTVTEVVLVLLLIVALFAFDASRKVNVKDNEIESLNEKIEILEEENTTLRKKNRKLKAEISKHRDTIKALEEYITPIQQGRSDQSKTIKTLIEDVKKLKERNRLLVRENEKLRNQLDKFKNTRQHNISLAKELERLKAENKALHAKLKKLTGGRGNIGSKGGSDAPRCFAKRSPRLILRITVFPNQYRIQKLWTRSNDGLHFSVPGMRSLVENSGLSIDAFTSLGWKIYNWGELQDPRCRFRAILDLSRVLNEPTRVTKKLQDTVERFFYIKDVTKRN